MESKKGMGRLKKWVPERGFGFIEAISEQGVRRDLFVHATAIRNDSAEPIIGVSATFTIGVAPKGLVALDVKFSPKIEITDAVIATLTTPVVL